MDDVKIKELLVNNFMAYSAISSQSDASKTQIPTSEGQRELALFLQKQLNSLGYTENELLDNGILIVRIAGNADKEEAKIGFVAHLDTVDVGLSADVKAQVLHYSGQRLFLNKDLGIFIDEESRPELAKYKDQDILFSDGTSVLGADNKAAISVMMTMAEYLKSKNIEHSDIYFAFVPDEEIGLLGAKELPLEKFPVDYCYTIDCCERGEIVYETFNAASAVFEIKGVTAHPMSAKNVLVNPNLLANDIISLLRDKGLPEQTEKREGYFWVIGLEGNQNCAKVTIHIRDFDTASFEERKKYLNTIYDFIKAKESRAEIKLTITDMYSNIASALPKEGVQTPALAKLYTAFEELNIEANTISMRGGTDGSALSVKGLFTPNFFTGAHNFHSAFEFLPLPSFVDSFKVALKLIEVK